MVSTLTTATVTSAAAAQSMADTYKKSEDRFTALEKRNDQTNDKAINANRGQVTVKIHYLVTGQLLLIILLLILYITKQEIKMSTNGLETNSRKLNEIENKVEAVEKKVEVK